MRIQASASGPNFISKIIASIIERANESEWQSSRNTRPTCTPGELRSSAVAYHENTYEIISKQEIARVNAESKLENIMCRSITEAALR